MLRISATSVDQFLKIGQPVHLFTDEIYTPEMYVADLKKGWQPTAAMMFGTAFGELITNPNRYYSKNGYKVTTNGFEYNFDAPQMNEGCRLMAEYREKNGMFWEIKQTIELAGATVVCKCDGLASNFLIENKTTASFKIDNYLDSYQWRLYFLAFPVEFIRYHVFSFAAENKAGYRKFLAHDSFEVTPYLEMRTDCESVIAEMSAFVYANNLESYFQPYEKR